MTKTIKVTGFRSGLAKRLVAVLTGVMIWTCVTDAHAGFLSGILGGKKDDPAPQQEIPPPPPQSSQPTKQMVEKDGKPVPTPVPPDPAVIKAGAAKLKKELSWEGVPSNLFQMYAGKWNGNFWVYSPQGKLEGKEAVKMECTPQADGTMKMVTFYHDTITKTWVTHETSVYSVKGDTINVTISGTRGEPARQVGHYNDQSVFLVNESKDTFESQRERIDGKRFLSDGFAVYNGKNGKEYHVFIGRLLKEN